MKSLISLTHPTNQEIDWDKKQILKLKLGDLYVLFTGEHNTINSVFSGVVLFCKTNAYKVGDFKDNFTKEAFEKINADVTITFQQP